jgi:hypothetical protein
VSDTKSEPPASSRRVVDETWASTSLISEAWVDLAEPVCDLGEMVVAETTDFLDSQYEQCESSNWAVALQQDEGCDSLSRMAEPKQDEGWVSQLGEHTEAVDEEPVSPLLCAPIAMVVPSRVLTVFEKPVPEPSQWVKSRHKGFCKLVGFPIESHEQECLALLQRIEADRFARKAASVPRRNQAPGLKGKRELRSLTSTVNYAGRQSTC